MKWIESITTDNFLSMSSENFPYDWTLDLFMRGFELEELNEKHCVVLAQLCRYTDPLHIFEVGTHLGKFATICAKNSNALITTTCLAREYLRTYSEYGRQHNEILTMSEIGKYYRMNDEQHRVRQLYENSAQIDMTRLYPDVDFIDMAIIDGSHEPSFLMRDTMLVIDYVRRGGIILWSDFYPELGHIPYISGVLNGIKKIIRECGIKPVWIEDTGWAGYIKR